MAKLLIVLAGLGLGVAALARLWFWIRVREKGRRRECSLTVGELNERLGVKPARRRIGELRDAAALGSALREAGLVLLERDGMSLARKRRTGMWSLRILPGMVAMILAFSLVWQRVRPIWVLAIGLVIVVLHVASRVAGISVELKAVGRAFEELRKTGGFRRLQEEEAVLECARASAWETVLPW